MISTYNSRHKRAINNQYILDEGTCVQQIVTLISISTLFGEVADTSGHTWDVMLDRLSDIKHIIIINKLV